METFLVLNGFEIRAAVEEQEKMILRLAAGTFSRDEFVAWLGAHVIASSLPPTV
jgi:death-on-curing protein